MTLRTGLLGHEPLSTKGVSVCIRSWHGEKAGKRTRSPKASLVHQPICSKLGVPKGLKLLMRPQSRVMPHDAVHTRLGINAKSVRVIRIREGLKVLLGVRAVGLSTGGETYGVSSPCIRRQSSLAARPVCATQMLERLGRTWCSPSTSNGPQPWD